MNERQIGLIRKAVPAFMLGVSALSLAGCQNDDPSPRPHEPTRSVNPQDEFRCESATYKTPRNRPGYVVVKAYDDNSPERVELDALIVTDLGSDFERKVEVVDGQAVVELPKSAIQVSVTALRGTATHSCGTIDRPNDEYVAPD